MIDWLFENSDAEAPETDVDLAWSHIQSKISQPIRKSWYTSPLFRVAASVAIVAIAVFGTQQYWNTSPLTEFAATSQGQEVVFPDGSRSILNELAVVSYPEKFDATRTVEFKGEAYFDIIKDTKPFIIKMDGIDVRVLGTAFNLTTAGDNVEVLVERGLVAFEKGGRQVKVAKGQLGIFNKATLEIKVDTTPPSNLMSWRTGKFQFEDAALSQVTDELAQFYNVNFKVSSHLDNCRVTAKFDNAPLEEVLKVLETVLNASVSQDKTTVKIKGKGC